MKELGIYFGPKVIDIVEAKGRRIVTHARIPLAEAPISELEEKVPFEVKMSALFSEALRSNKIQAKEAVLSLSGKDLIIRTFEMPNLPKEEMAGAVRFEAKKYIPFKAEELISDYQVTVDRASRVNTVLFIGIKKESLDKYFNIFNQLNINITRIEYSGFSVLRALKLAGAKDAGITGMLCADFMQNDEVNFTVLENGFPLFSRDINLDNALGAAGGFEESAPQPVDLLEKIEAEIRVSLDYYQRKFPGKGIKKIFILANYEQYAELEAFIGELGISVKLIDFAKAIGKPVAYSSSLAKGCCAALNKAIPTKVNINLAQAKTRLPKAGAAGKQFDAGALFKGIKIDPRAVISGALICAAAFGYGIYQANPLKQELNNIISQRPAVKGVDGQLSYGELDVISLGYRQRLNKLDSLIKQQFYLTHPLDAIPRAIPDGVWLTNFSLNKKEAGRGGFVLEGMCFLGDGDKEFKAVNQFLGNLKQSPELMKFFPDISIFSIDQKKTDKLTVTSFSISSGKDYQGAR